MKPEDVPDAWVSVARDAMIEEIGGRHTVSFDDHARAALAAVIPLVREEERGKMDERIDKEVRDALSWCLNWLAVMRAPEIVIENAEKRIRARRDALQRDIDEYRAAIRARNAP